MHSENAVSSDRRHSYAFDRNLSMASGTAADAGAAPWDATGS